MKFIKKIPWLWWIATGGCFVIAIFSYFRISNQYELISYDLRLKLRPSLKVSPDIVLIEISDDTLKNLGKWPLPRDFHASLIKVLKEYGAKQIIFDILFSEPTLYDELLSGALKEAGNVYLALAFYLENEIKRNYLPASSRAILGEICPTLEKSAAGKGHVNVLVDSDGKVRRTPLFIQYGNTLFPSLSLKAACDWQGLDAGKVEFKRDEVIIDHKLCLPVSFAASFLVNYPDKWEKSFKHLSYFAILKSYSDIKKNIKPEIDLNILRGKACFVGLTATGTADLRAMPLENIYPMMGLQASVFNSLLQKRFIKDVGAYPNTLLNIIIFFLSLILCLRLTPLRALVGNCVLGLAFFVLSTAILILYGIWTDLFLPLLLIIVVSGCSMFYRFINEVRKRQLLEKELDIARTIQESFLPKDIKQFSNLSISSFMHPAKFVAGDFYDIVVLDNQRLGVLIGDVSGKGVPASLIMAQTISLFRIFSRQNLNCADVLGHLNKELCGKFSGRFVTALYLVFDTQEGKVWVSSAGQAPLLVYKKNDNQVREAELAMEMPLGIMEEVAYRVARFDMSPGDKIMVFTDGLNEARNRDAKEFGIENIKKLLLDNAKSTPCQIAQAIKDEIYKFSQHCPQHDDITSIVISVEG